MLLPLLAPLVMAARIEGRINRHPFRIGLAVADQQLLGDPLQVDATDAGRGPGEVFVDDRLVQADRLADLRAAVALDGGDAHLGHGLDDPLDGGLDEIFDACGVVQAGEQPLVDHVVDGLEGHVRINGGHAVAEQHGEVVHLARFARLQDQRHMGAGGGPDQMMMQAGHGQQGRDGGVIIADAPIGKDQDGRA